MKIIQGKEGGKKEIILLKITLKLALKLVTHTPLSWVVVTGLLTRTWREGAYQPLFWAGTFFSNSLTAALNIVL